MKSIFGVLLLLLFTGCGPAIVTLSGNVTVNGQPLEKGIIDFTPLDKAPLSTPAEVVNGRYQLQLAIGKKQVSISRPVVTDRKPEHPGPGAPLIEFTKESLPAKYNSQTELTFDVTSATKEKNFPLTVP